MGSRFYQGFMKRILIGLVDMLAAPFVYPAGFLLKAIRFTGVNRLPFCKRVLLQVGVFPIRKHYTEPLFDGRSLRKPLSQERDLPGIDWNVDGQLRLLEQFRYKDELSDVPLWGREGDGTFFINNGYFQSGDAEYLYNLIRLKKPHRIYEVGSGYSTLIAIRAVQRNKEEVPGYACEHLCIEPFRNRWLERTGVSVIRQRVEDIDRNLFSTLGKDDLLFIDSSHVIRPQGDVLFEYLELLPSLNPGVIVHVHDIFSPRDYKKEWIVDEVILWNEQYLLEAFLTGNRDWKVIGALNYLYHHHYDRLRSKCPFLTPEREVVSFYIQKIG